MSFGSILSRNFPFIFVMVIIVYTIIYNRKLYGGVKRLFLTLMGLTFAELVASQYELYFKSLPEGYEPRFYMCTISYVVRPLILYVVLLVIIRNKSKRIKTLCFIPAALTLVLFTVNLFTNIIFGISSQNTFYGGPISEFRFIVLIVYIAMIAVMTFFEYDIKVDGRELTTIFIGIVFIVANILFEVFLDDYQGQSQMVTALSILVYVIHFKSVADIREKLKLEKTELKTGLLNENACIERLESMNRDESIRDYAVFYFDLMRFGLINEKYGMEVGNKVLSAYSKQIVTMMHGEEMLARQGGDRFIAIVRKRNMDIFLGAMDSTRVTFTEEGEEFDFNISAHAGVFLINEVGLNGEEIISNAHSALAYGKTAGVQICYLTDELKNNLKDQKQFIIDIPIAMSNEEFLPYYQPKVNSRSGMLCGAEALVRWMKDGQLIPPGKFIPIMESKDLMCDMDFYMLRHVCADIANWIAHGVVPPVISVNFSRRNLSNPNLAADINDVVTGYHVPKKMIEIEITETIDEFPISVLNGFVDELHKLGFRVAVDDFGSGSSSLSLLREVTFDTLKIDKGFVDRAFAKDLTILNYIIKLSKALGVEVLAEGVEQREQVDTLLSLECEIIQGYYYDKPLPRAEFEERIIAGRYNDGKN